MNYSEITLQYYVVFGKGDSSDTLDWEMELNEAQKKAYKKAVMTRTELEDVVELAELCDKAYPEIEEVEMQNSIDAEDEFTLECMGEAEVDPEEINDLVHSGDSHAIEFFGLENLSEDELEDWDAYDLDELPLIKDFEEDFEPQSPYDVGWSLEVQLPDVCDIEIESEDIEAYLRELKEDGDEETIRTVVEAQEEYYESDEFDSLEEFVASL